MSVISLENELMTLVNEFSRLRIYKKQKSHPNMSELMFLESKFLELESKIDHLSKPMNHSQSNMSGSEIEKTNELLRLYNKLRLQTTDEIKDINKSILKFKGK